MQNNKNKVLFRLRDDALIVANTGTPFTRRGVISVCYAHLSEKGQTPPEDTYECSDENLVGEIRKQAIAVYRMDKNRLQMDAAEESTINKDYSGRILWELLQNADDAAKGVEEKANLVGEKGLGFKSVLEITREPEIYSGPFHFRFSSEETERVLQQEGLESHQLTFRVPHLSEPSEECMELLEEYDTVIRLPFYGNEAKEEIVKKLREINAHCLLLRQQIDVIEVAIDGKVNILEIDRKTVRFAAYTSDLTITTRDNTGSLNKKKWRRWLWVQKKSESGKRLSVAVCLPFNGDEIVACETALPLHVFFPTSERIGAKALIHASFDLAINREHLAKKQRSEGLLIAVIERIVGKILAGIPPSSALDAFGDIVTETAIEDGSDGSDLIQRLKKSIVKIMKETRFVPVVGGDKVRPEEIGIWEHNLGNVVRDDKESDLLIPELNEDWRRREILEKLTERSHIPTFFQAEYLRDCRNDSLEDCWRAFESADSMMESELDHRHSPEAEMVADVLREVPFWFTEEGHARAFDDESRKPLLLEKPDGWPAWLPADSLASEFRARIRKLLSERGKRVKLTSSDFRGNEYQIGQWPLHGKKQFLNTVLYPFLVEQDYDNWSSEQHFRVLSQVMQWSERIDFNDISPLVIQPLIMGKDDERNQLGRQVCVPTDKGWLPAIYCYAGEDWGGPLSFDKYFKEEYFKRLEDRALKKAKDYGLFRGLVLPFKEWPEEIKAQYTQESWKSLLRFLGVSWELKLLHLNLYGWGSDSILKGVRYFFDSKRDEIYWLVGPALHWADCLYDPKEKEVEEHPSIRAYKAYCLSEARHSTANFISGGVSILMEYFPQAMEKSPTSEILHAVERIFGKIKKRSSVEYSYSHGEFMVVADSFAIFQLKNMKWLPHKPAVFQEGSHAKPDNVYMPGCSLKGLLPEIDRSGIDDEYWPKIMRMLIELGVRESLPDEPSPFHKWMGRLAERKNSRNELRWEPHKERGPIAKAAKAIFGSYIEKFGKLPPHIPAPFLRRDNQGEFLDFAPSSDLVWADKPDFDKPEVRRKVLDVKSIKVFFLFLGEGKQADLAPLSGKLNLLLKYSGEDMAESKILQDRYDERKKILDKIAKCNLSEKAIRICAMKRMYLKSEDYPDIRPDVDFYYEGTTLNVNVQNGSKWGALAGGLSDISEKTEFQPDFENFLRDEKYEECMKRLRKRYNLTEEALRDLEEINQSEVPGPFGGGKVGTRQPGQGAGGDELPPSPVSGEGRRVKKGSDIVKWPESDNGRLPKPETGGPAERWLENALKSKGFTVNRTHIGSDYEIELNGRRAFIEIKRIEAESGSIYWSKKQIEKAQECQRDKGSYFIAIVYGNNEENHKVFWFWNPLEDLLQMDRTRIWKKESEGIAVAEDSGWKENLPPQNMQWKDPTYSVRIKIDVNAMRRESNSGFSCLRERLAENEAGNQGAF